MSTHWTIIKHCTSSYDYISTLLLLFSSNDQPLTSTNTPHSLPDSSRHAIVTTLYGDNFAPAVATLGHSLHKVDSHARLLVFYIPSQVSPRALCIASSTGFEPYAVDRIAPPHDGKGVHRHFVDQYTKLKLWTLDALGIESLVYLDADTLVKRSFDELFALPWNFAAVPDVYLDQKGFTVAFNAGVLFLRPNSTTYEHMLSQLSSASYPSYDAEQSFLNHYFGAEAVRLPYSYNYNLAIKKRGPLLWDTLWDEARIIHFTLAKPFLALPRYVGIPWERIDDHVKKEAVEWAGGFYGEEIIWWGNMFAEMKKVHAAELGSCQLRDASL